MSIAALILAAGSSSRLGFPKQLLQFYGQSLVARAGQAALLAGCRPVAVVTGAYAEQISSALEMMPVKLVNNPSWAEGMGSSISCGVQFLQSESFEQDAILVMLTDQPLVDDIYLNSLIAAFYSGPGMLAVSVYPDGALGVPAIFHRSLWHQLLKLKGNQGAKAIIMEHEHIATKLPFAGGSWDIDTPADWPVPVG